MWKIHKQITHKTEVNGILWSFDDSILFIADSHGKINLYDGQILEASSLLEPQFQLSGGH
jgi:sugar lactone lactonase YvrE